MIDLVTDWSKIQEFWEKHKPNMATIQGQSVVLNGLENPNETLRWCLKQTEQITCLVTSIRPQYDSKGQLVSYVFKNKHPVFVFDTVDTAAIFKLTFIEFYFDFWNAQRD